MRMIILIVCNFIILSFFVFGLVRLFSAISKRSNEKEYDSLDKILKGLGYRRIPADTKEKDRILNYSVGLIIGGGEIFYHVIRSSWDVSDTSHIYTVFPAIVALLSTELLTGRIATLPLLKYAYKAKIELIELKIGYGIELTEEERSVHLERTSKLD